MRRCEDCAADITARHGNAYLCLPCVAARLLAYRRRRSYELYRGPRATERLTYSAAWNRRRRARRVLDVVQCADGCGRTFEVNRIGRRRLFHIECSAFHEGYRNIAKYAARRARANRRAA